MRKIKTFIASMLVAIGVFSYALPTAQVGAQDIDLYLQCGANLDFTIDQIEAGCPNESGVSSGERVDQIVTSVVNILSLIVGAVAVVMIIIGGFRYVTSGGDSNSVTSAKNTILYAIVGLIVVALAQVVVRFVIDRATLTGSSSSSTID